MAPRIESTGNACTQTTDTGNPGPGTQSRLPDKTESSSSKRKSTYTTYSLWQKLNVLDYMKASSEADASGTSAFPEQPCGVGKDLELYLGQKIKSTKGKHVRRGVGQPLTYYIIYNYYRSKTTH